LGFLGLALFGCAAGIMGGGLVVEKQRFYRP